MDIFVEKIVSKKRGTKDYLIIAGIVLAVILLAFIVTPFLLQNGMLIIVYAVLIYGAKFFICKLNIEYEYSVTNGAFDIDKIVNQKKRKSLFSAECKDIEIMAKVKGSKYNQSITATPYTIKAVSTMDSPDVYFAVINSGGKKTLVYFEPNEKMLKAIKTIIPSKLFIE